MGFYRSMVSVSGFTILSRLTGFIRETLQAHYIGVNAVSDALGIAIKIPSLFRRIFAEGALNASFVPMFSSIMSQEGRGEALRFATNIFSLLAIVLTVLVVAIEFFLPDLIPLMFRGLVHTPDRLALTIQFSKITFPFLLFISFTAFFSGILNSFERFTAAASSPVAGNLFIIFSLVCLSETLHSPGYALAWGILGCGVVQFLWVFVPCQWSGFFVRPRLPRLTPSLRKFFGILLPAALGSGVVQINLFLDIVIASYLKVGGISYLNYADRLAQLPLSVIGAAMSTVLLPTLSRQLSGGNRAEAERTQSAALQMAMTLTMAPTIGLIALASFLVRHLYAHGAFTEDSILPTAYTLQALATGLPAYILLKLLNTTFFANGDTKTPMMVGIFGVFFNVTLNLILIQRWEYVGLALSTSISAWVQVAILSVVLRRRRLLYFGEELGHYAKRIALPIVSLVGYFWVLDPLWQRYWAGSLFSAWVILPVIITPPLILYLGQIYLLKLITPAYLKKI